MKISEAKQEYQLQEWCGMVIADGSKSSTILMEEFRASRNMWKLLLLSTCAMIRQYD